MDNLERLAKLETQVEAIKEDVAEVKSDIRELHSRITTGNREIMQKIDEKIDDLAKADTEQHKLLKESMDKVKSRVDILERWRWMVVGAAIALGFMIGNLEIFSRLFR